MKVINNIQYITQDSEIISHAEQAKLMFKNGVSWVQIRMKNSSTEEFLAESKKAMAYAKQYNGTLIINDNVEICMQVGAHALHLGLNDMSINKAREIIGKDVIIGGTANTVVDVIKQVKRGADYVGLGPFRFTTTKKNLSPIIGLEGYKNIVSELKERNCNIPIFAVGGITMEDVELIKETGIHGVAISTSVLNAMLEKKLKTPHK